MVSGALHTDSPDDPIDILLSEHRTILQILDEVERESRRLEANAALRESFWFDLLRFLDDFDAGVHHTKEERLLFPALEASGLSPTSGPTAVLRDDHLRCHFLRDRIEQTLRQRDRSRLQAAVASYLDLARAHVLKENQILFPLARRLISQEALAILRREFGLLSAELSVAHWLRHPYVQPIGS